MGKEKENRSEHFYLKNSLLRTLFLSAPKPFIPSKLFFFHFFHVFGTYTKKEFKHSTLKKRVQAFYFHSIRIERVRRLRSFNLICYRSKALFIIFVCLQRVGFSHFQSFSKFSLYD